MASNTPPNAPPKVKLYNGPTPHNCSLCAAAGVVEAAEGYCPDCNALFSAKCWATHHRQLGIKTHKAWALQKPATAVRPVVPTASSSPSLLNAQHPPVADKGDQIGARAATAAPSTIVSPPPAYAQPAATSPAPSNNTPPPYAQYAPAKTSASSPKDTAVTPSASAPKLDAKAAAKAEKKRKEEEKEKAKQAEKDEKERKKELEKQAKNAKKLGPGALPPASGSVSPRSDQSSPAKRRGSTSSQPQTAAATAQPVSPRPDAIQPTSPSPLDGKPASVSPSNDPGIASPRDKAGRRAAPSDAASSPRERPPSVSQKPVVDAPAHRSPVLTRGQSSLLNYVGQQGKSTSPPNVTNVVTHRAKSSAVPCYHLIGLEGDIKALSDQSSAGDYAVVLQENVARLINDFAPNAVRTGKENATSYDQIDFGALTRLAVPMVGIHGNKEEILTFLATRTPKVGAHIIRCFDKPGLYAIVGSSAPGGGGAPAEKANRRSVVASNVHYPANDSSHNANNGQLTVFLVLWHPTDAFMSTFASNSRALQLFAFLNALSSYRLVFYSEQEAARLLRMDTELISSRQDITDIKTLPESMRDSSVKPRAEGTLLFGKTSSVSLDRVLVPALLSTGVYGASVETLPGIDLLFGTHSVAVHVSEKEQAKSAQTDHSVMALALDSVPNLLAQWGSNGTIDLSELPDDQFDDLLTDGKAPDWKAKKEQIAEALSRVEDQAGPVPQFPSAELLIDNLLRAYMRNVGNMQALDMIFQQSVDQTPPEQLPASFISSVNQPMPANLRFDSKVDELLLKTYDDKIQLASIAPETPYLVALSRLALARSALRLVRVLKNKSPDDQSAFIVNTMDSSEEEVAQLQESLQGYPEFEKTHHNYFQSADLRTEQDTRIRWYFISLYDNLIFQTRNYILGMLQVKGITTLEQLQTRGGTMQRAAFETWKASMVASYRTDLNNRLKSIFDFRVLSSSATGIENASLSRNVVLGYRRDASTGSATMELKAPSDNAKSKDAQHSIISFTSPNWAMGDHSSLSEGSIRVLASSCKTFNVPMDVDPKDIRQKHTFYSSNLNVVITVNTSKTKNETQIFAAGGALLGTLPVYCSHVAFSEETQLMALCGDYIQLYRLLDGARAMSTVPLLSFYMDSRTYGVLEHVVVVGEVVYLHTKQSTGPHSNKDAPPLPPRPDGVGANGDSNASTVCHIYRADASGVCIRLSPATGIPAFQRLLVHPSQSHLILVRYVPDPKAPSSPKSASLVAELWELTGLSISVFTKIPIGHPASNVASMHLVGLNGTVYIASAKRPHLSNGTLKVRVYLTHLTILAKDFSDKDSAINQELRHVHPCENYLAYFAEVAMKFTTTSALTTGAQNAARALANKKATLLRVVLATSDANLFRSFAAYIDRHRSMLRFAILSTEKLYVKNAALQDVYQPLSSTTGAKASPADTKPEPIVPYLHHTLLKVVNSNEFASSTAKDDIAEESGLFSLASFMRAILCSVPVPLVTNNSRGSLVACLNGTTNVLPFSQISALQAPVPGSAASPSYAANVNPSIPNQIASLLSFGMIEPLVQSWTMPVKIVTSFGSVGTGKTSLLNHLFGTFFETSRPESSPIFAEKLGSAIASGAASPIGALLSLVPTASTLYIVIDFEALMSQRSAREQSLLALFNLLVSNLTLWRSATPLIDEHFEVLRSYSMEKERLVSWTQNPALKPMLPWPKSYNTLLMLGDTGRVNDIVSASKHHYNITKSTIKRFESNPGPHAKPVMHSIFRNRWAALALPLPLRSKGADTGFLTLTPKNWVLGPMRTNYIHQSAAFYQGLADSLAPFLSTCLSFSNGVDALNHIKRHLSYILWSQTTTQELPPRLEAVVKELDEMASNALIFGQQIRIGAQVGKNRISQAPATGSSNDYVHQQQSQQVGNQGEQITIDPLCDLSDPSKVVGCPMIDFNCLGIPEPLTTDFQRLQQYFPEEGLVLPLGADPLPFRPESQQEWKYYSYIDVIILWNRHVCDREQAYLDSDWMYSLQLFLNMLIMRRALRVDFWIQLHTADVPAGTHLHRKVVILREKVACHFERVKAAWKLCGAPCANCYYTCTLQKGHPGNHDCLVPQQHKCTAKCPRCQLPCPVQAGHRRDGVLHKCPNNCQATGTSQGPTRR